VHGVHDGSLQHRWQLVQVTTPEKGEASPRFRLLLLHLARAILAPTEELKGDHRHLVKEERFYWSPLEEEIVLPVAERFVPTLEGHGRHRQRAIQGDTINQARSRMHEGALFRAPRSEPTDDELFAQIHHFRFSGARATEDE
jgi:hypothetical protein